MQVYRISKNTYAKTLRASGKENRWNSEGTFVIYCASSLCLACLEVVVNTSGKLLINQNFSSIIIEIPEKIAATVIDINTLLVNWKEAEQKNYTLKIGDEWYVGQETLLLQVPSAIISREVNYIINTEHPDFSKVFISEIDSFMFDRRIKS